MGRPNDKLLLRFKGNDVTRTQGGKGLLIYKDGGLSVTLDFCYKLIALLEDENFMKNFTDKKHFYQVGNIDTGGTENRKVLTILDDHQLFKSRELGQIFIHAPQGNNFSLDIELLYLIEEKFPDGIVPEPPAPIEEEIKRPRRTRNFGSNPKKQVKENSYQIAISEESRNQFKGMNSKQVAEYMQKELGGSIYRLTNTVEGSLFPVHEYGEIPLYEEYYLCVTDGLAHTPKGNPYPNPFEIGKNSAISFGYPETLKAEDLSIYKEDGAVTTVSIFNNEIEGAKQIFEKYKEEQAHLIDNDRYDCAEIADDLEGLLPRSQRLEIVVADAPRRKTFKVIEFGQVKDFEYHHAIVADGVVYDPRHTINPQPIEDYKNDFKKLNPDVELTFELIS